MTSPRFQPEQSFGAPRRCVVEDHRTVDLARIAPRLSYVAATFRTACCGYVAKLEWSSDGTVKPAGVHAVVDLPNADGSLGAPGVVEWRGVPCRLCDRTYTVRWDRAPAEEPGP